MRTREHFYGVNCPIAYEIGLPIQGSAGLATWSDHHRWTCACFDHKHDLLVILERPQENFDFYPINLLPLPHSGFNSQLPVGCKIRKSYCWAERHNIWSESVLWWQLFVQYYQVYKYGMRISDNRWCTTAVYAIRIWHCPILLCHQQVSDEPRVINWKSVLLWSICQNLYRTKYVRKTNI